MVRVTLIFKKTMKKLSSKLSEAILQALEDLEYCMNDEKYVVNFDSWHNPIKTNTQQFNKGSEVVCSVCFAGAVMANRLGADFDKVYMPGQFAEAATLQALDFIRQGKIHLALMSIFIDRSQIKDKIPSTVEVNQNDYKQFVEQMKGISKLLSDINF
jgi:hypothetical protein